MSDKHLITTAKFVSTMFTPLCVPLLAFAILFTFSYLSLLTLGFRLVVLGMVASFTIILPKFAILLYRKMNGWTLRQASKRKNRVVPYLLTITCYIACLYLMYSLAMPRFLSAIIMAGLIVLVICITINLWWKISTHMAGIGGLIGGLIPLSMSFEYNMTWWMCCAIIFAGMLGTSRMILRQHSLGQIIVGFFVGFFSAFCIIYKYTLI
ncbi:MAG: hypothetical protein J6M59_07995 [Bacteroidaceae bacterium]|nr:hypothetical protein [Bacteroidaceae bacterium]